MGYNSAADNTGLSSFIQPLMIIKSAKSHEMLREFEIIAGQVDPRSSIVV